MTETLARKLYKISLMSCLIGIFGTQILAAPSDDGHDYVLNESKSVRETCTEEGTLYYECTMGDAFYEETVPKREHIFEEIIKEPTCSKAGQIMQVCKFCGEYIVTGYIEALGHEYIEGNIVNLIDSKEMTKEYICVRGDASYTETFSNTIQDSSTLNNPKEVIESVKEIKEIDIIEEIEELEAVEAVNLLKEIENLEVKGTMNLKEDIDQTVDIDEEPSSVDQSHGEAAIVDKRQEIINGVLMAGILMSSIGFMIPIYSDIRVLKWNKKKKEAMLEKQNKEKR